MTEDRDTWRKYVHDVANPRIARTAEEQELYIRRTPPPAPSQNAAAGAAAVVAGNLQTGW